MDDIIKSRGEKVSPKEVENVLYSHPEIAEAAVVGVPDEILGQAIKAVVVVKSGSELTDRDVMRHCASRLEDFMVPKRVEFRPLLPKTPNGKIDKKALFSSPGVHAWGSEDNKMGSEPLQGLFAGKPLKGLEIDVTTPTTQA